MNKKIFALMFCMIFLVGTISAFEFDNVISYTNENKTAIFENIFGLGSVLGEAELTSHNSVNEIKSVMPGENRAVMYYKFSKWEIYENGLGEVSFIDMKTENEVKKDYYFAKAVYKNITVIDYGKDICTEVISSNGTFEECEKNIIGSHMEQQFDNWERLETNDIPKEEVTIALITDVLPNEHLDGVWTIAGKKLLRHAQWTDSFNDFLIAGYNFEGTTTILEDVTGNGYNLTENVVDGYPFNISGIIGDGQNFSYEGGIGPAPGNFNASHVPIANLNRNMSFSIWSTLDDAWIGANPTIFSTGNSGIGIGWARAINDKVQVFHVGVGVLGTGCAVNNGTFTHYGLVVHQNGSVILYINGTRCDTFTTTENFADNNGANAGINSAGGGIGTISDEYYIWNRSLSDQEMSDLFNGGLGITFTIPPIVTLNSPANDTNFSENSIIFNCSSESTLSSMSNISLLINGEVNFTISNTTALQKNISLQTNVTSLVDGIYNWTCISSDINNNVGTTETRIFTVDSIPPIINLTYPTGQIDSHSIGDALDLNWTVTDLNLDSCWFEYNLTNTTVTCGDNTTTFNTVVGKQNITFYANDSSNNINSEITSWTYGFLENSITANTSTNETSSETFILNLTTDIIIQHISSVLTYNSTDYISTSNCVGGECILSNIIDIPLVNIGESQNNSFFWNLTIFNGTDSIVVETSTRYQNVSKIYLEECNATWTTKTLNFTVYDEQNLSRISPFNFNGAFDFWLGSGTVKRNNSFSNNVTEMNLCLSPNTTTQIDATIDYDEKDNQTLYTSRFYYFDTHAINNVLQHIKMYLLKSTSSTSFILKVEDENLLPVSDALIEIHRYYPGENIFRIVQIAKTDDNGKSIGFFETEIVDYKFIIKKVGVTLLETGQQKVIPETSPFTLTFNTGGEFDEPWTSQQDIIDFESNLTYNKNTQIVTFTYLDNSTNFTNSRLFVQQRDLGNISAYVTICNETSTLSSASLTCDITNTTNFYIAAGYVTRDGTETLIDLINFQIESVSDVVGLLGLFFGWFLILISGFMFKFNEVAGIWAVTVTIFLINLTGLIKFGSVFVTAIIAIAIILTWVMER